MEHALCLVVLTDYISCAYNQRNFYRTFENALTEKFIDSLFEKLLKEWTKVFSSRPPLIRKFSLLIMFPISVEFTNYLFLQTLPTTR